MNAAGVIALGSVPEPQVVVHPVGDPVGNHVPVVGSLYRAPLETTHYAGTGVQHGDVVHFAPHSWHPKPLTINAAIEQARAMAEVEGRGWIKLPDSLD